MSVWREGEIDKETKGTHETKKYMEVWETAKRTKRLRKTDTNKQVRESVRARENAGGVYTKKVHISRIEN